MEPFIGEIIMFGGNFAPRGWALCDGQLLSISENSALFSILGTTYGGDGRTTFGLPDLRGRVPVHPGHGPGVDSVSLGQKGGANKHTLTALEIPAHSHTFNPPCSGDTATLDAPANAFPAEHAEASYATSTDESMGQGTTGNAGGGQSFNIMQPFLGVNFIIALQGTYPSRN